MLNFDHAVNRAIDRDLRDEERLEWLASRVTTWLDELIPELCSGSLEHPKARWHPGDLAEALREQLTNIRSEQENLKGPVFVDEDWP